MTYGASGSTRDRTIRATEAIAQHTTLRAVAHLTCASQSREQIRRVIGSYAAAGIRHILAIRGDMPGGPRVPWVRHPDGLSNATELVEMVRELVTSASGWLHSRAASRAWRCRRLTPACSPRRPALVQALPSPSCSSLRRTISAWSRVRSLGCDIPILPGIMPITVKQVRRFAELRAALPTAVTDRIAAVADDEDQVRKVGIEIATEQCEALLEGAPGCTSTRRTVSGYSRDLRQSPADPTSSVTRR